MEELVLYELREQVAVITLNRPDKRNAVSNALVAALEVAVDRAGADRTVRTVVLRGAGKGFCAGGDISSGKVDGIISAHADLENTQRVTKKLFDLCKPTVAVVQGAAAGMGFSLALACDTVVCAENAKFIMSFANVGLVPDSGATYMLPRVVGLKKAKELMFTARPVLAPEALALGIANVVVPEEKLEETAFALAEQMAALSPNSVKYIKQLLNKSAESTMEELLQMECCYQSMAMCSEDAMEAVKAFFEERKPVYNAR